MPIPFKRWSYGLIRRKRAVSWVLWQTPCAGTHVRSEVAQPIEAEHS